MKNEDFRKFKNFSYKEVAATGANILMLRMRLFHYLQSFRNTIDRKVIILENGLNSGEHKSLFHQNSEAVDFTLDPDEGEIDVNYIVAILIQTGFKGIGVYWNGEIYSFHADLRYIAGLWKADKSDDGLAWEYEELLSSDPKKLFK
jgi:hypothetical protein